MRAVIMMAWHHLAVLLIIVQYLCLIHYSGTVMNKCCDAIEEHFDAIT